jgi:putative resolvase
MYNITQFSKIIGFSVKTLQRWDREGILKPETRTKTNRRLYTDKQLKEVNNNLVIPKRMNVVYCRVSSTNQRKDLSSQKNFLIDFTKNMGLSVDEIYTDIGSGMNFKRKNFLRLIKEVNEGKIESITIAHKDRLCRFGFELIEFMCEDNNVKINIINDDRLSPEQELCQDLTSIIHVFSSRLYGLRKYKNKIKEICKKSENEF